MDLICDDVINIIIEMLRPIDIFSLTLVNKRFIKYKPNMDDLVYKYLVKFTDIPDSIMILIKNNKIYLYGSSILQILYDEVWDTDINFIINYNTKNLCIEISEILQKGQYEFISISNTFLYVNGSHYTIYGRIRQGILPAFRNIYRIINHPIIDITFSKTVSVYEYMNGYCDISICKNLYGNGKLKIYDLEGIIKKTFTNKGINKNRIKKYINRGFILIT